jgi:putative hydrolase
MRLMELAAEAGCRFAIDSDAHAPGQLDWQPHGCARAVQAGLTPDQIVNTWDVEELLAWTGRDR